MNNQPLNKVSNKPFRYSSNLFLTLLCACVFTALTVLPALGQSSMWRYVTTSISGSKTYLNDERKSLTGKNQGAWEKMVSADGSSVVTLVEWDCAGKSRLIRQITYFDSNLAAVGGKNQGFSWSAVVPGSAGDFLYHRLCLPAVPQKWAHIIVDRTSLRAYPDNAASVMRVARRDERFQIVPESGLGGWFNIIDPETQQDYWLRSDWFDTIEVEQPTKKQSAAAKNAPVVIKLKAQKANAQSVKTGNGRKRVNR